MRSISAPKTFRFLGTLQQFGWCLFFIFILLGFRTVSCKLDIGPLYNCGVTQYSGIYALPTQYQCHKNFDENKLITYNASVRQYRPRETSFYVYHCEAQMITLSCNTLFFGSKEKSHTTRAISVTKRHWFIAFRTKMTPLGMLHPDGINQWWTTTRTAYNCKCEEKKTPLTWDLQCTVALLPSCTIALQYCFFGGISRHITLNFWLPDVRF